MAQLSLSLSLALSLGSVRGGGAQLLTRPGHAARNSSPAPDPPHTRHGTPQVDEMLERMSYGGNAPSSDTLAALCQESLRRGDAKRATAMAEALRDSGHHVPSYLVYRLEQGGAGL